MIREQSETLQANTEEQMNTLKTFVASSPIAQQQAALLEKPIDPVTNLPTRAFAENLIQERLANKTDCMVGLVIINRFTGLQGRFGPAHVDDLVRAVVKQLAQRLPEATTLCRWSANSFVAITDIVSSYAESSQQWRRVSGLKVEKQIEDESRTALVVLNTSVMLEHLRPLASKRALIQNLDRFVMLQSGELAA
jgi:GGDEF domain-containing protein